MEYYNKIVCVTYEDLTSGNIPVMSLGALTKLVQRNKSLRVRRGCSGKEALIDYYALPERYRQRFEELHGDPKELMKEEERKASLRIDPAARSYYEGYRYTKGSLDNVALPISLIEEYTINASVLNLLQERYNDTRAYRNALGGSAFGIWDIIAAMSEELRETYRHTLPANLARLKHKMKQYREAGYGCLVSGKVGNRNTTIISEEAGRYIVALKRSAVPVYTDSQILAEYNRTAPARGWRQLKTLTSLRQYLNRPEVTPLWYDAVVGELKAHQRYSRKNSTELPSMRDSLWYGDGTRLNLYYRATENGRTVVRTMQVYEVMDAYSEVLLGYYISETEDYEAQYHAYRMAVQTAGHKPYELVCDNQGGHKKLKSQDFFKKICRVYRPTAPYSGQSKTIESVFGRFQAQVLHKDWRFTGQNITAKKSSSRPNLERINANTDKLYTLDELKEAYALARKEWNESRHPATGEARIEMYNRSVNPETEAVGAREMADIFWMWTGRPSTYTDSGLKVTIKGRTYQYEVMERPGIPDHSFLRNNYGRRFYAMYDPYDPRSIRLYTEDADGSRRFAAIAEPRIVIHRAIQEQTEGERAFIAAQAEANRMDRIERQAAARAIELEHGTAPEQQGLSRPKLAGINKRRDITELEIERRMKKYRRAPEPVTPGRIGKIISNAIYNPATGDIEIDERQVAGKL